MEGERDEGLKAAGLVLERAQAEQVVYAVIEGLDVPVEHRGVRPDAEAMGDAVDLDPLVGGGLVVRDPRADFRVEDLGASPGQAVEPRALQPLEDLPVGHPVVLGEEVDLHGREALEVNVGLDPLEASQELLVVREGKAWVKAVDDVDLARRVTHANLELAPGLLDLHRVSPGRALFELGEGAEEARRNADVGHLDAHVAVEVRAVAVQPLADGVGELPDGDDVGMEEKRDAILEREPFARL